MSAIVAGAKVEVNASISLAKTAGKTYTGTWTVPKTSKSGWLAVGAQSNSMTWKYVRTNGTCSTTVIRSGTANLPTRIPYFHHS